MSETVHPVPAGFGARIGPLRTDHIDGSAILFDGVRPDHDPAKMAAAIRANR